MANERFLSITQRLYGLLVTGASFLQSPFLLIVRLYWGWQFFLTGKGKLLNLERTSNFFSSLNIPMPTVSALLNSSLECVGGLLLVVGLASRLISIPLALSMVIAYLTADFEKVQAIFSDPDKFVTADEFLFLFAVLLILVFGPGVFSLDYLIKKRLQRSVVTKGESGEARH